MGLTYKRSFFAQRPEIASETSNEINQYEKLRDRKQILVNIISKAV